MTNTINKKNLQLNKVLDKCKICFLNPDSDYVKNISNNLLLEGDSVLQYKKTDGEKLDYRPFFIFHDENLHCDLFFYLTTSISTESINNIEMVRNLERRKVLPSNIVHYIHSATKTWNNADKASSIDLQRYLPITKDSILIQKPVFDYLSERDNDKYISAKYNVYNFISNDIINCRHFQNSDIKSGMPQDWYWELNNDVYYMFNPAYNYLKLFTNFALAFENQDNSLSKETLDKFKTLGNSAIDQVCSQSKFIQKHNKLYQESLSDADAYSKYSFYHSLNRIRKEVLSDALPNKNLDYKDCENTIVSLINNADISDNYSASDYMDYIKEEFSICQKTAEINKEIINLLPNFDGKTKVNLSSYTYDVATLKLIDNNELNSNEINIIKTSFNSKVDSMIKTRISIDNEHTILEQQREEQRNLKKQQKDSAIAKQEMIRQQKQQQIDKCVDFLHKNYKSMYMNHINDYSAVLAGGKNESFEYLYNKYKSRIKDIEAHNGKDIVILADFYKKQLTSLYNYKNNDQSNYSLKEIQNALQKQIGGNETPVNISINEQKVSRDVPIIELYKKYFNEFLGDDLSQSKLPLLKLPHNKKFFDLCKKLNINNAEIIDDKNALRTLVEDNYNTIFDKFFDENGVKDSLDSITEFSETYNNTKNLIGAIDEKLELITNIESINLDFNDYETKLKKIQISNKNGNKPLNFVEPEIIKKTIEDSINVPLNVSVKNENSHYNNLLTKYSNEFFSQKIIDNVNEYLIAANLFITKFKQYAITYNTLFENTSMKKEKWSKITEQLNAELDSNLSDDEKLFRTNYNENILNRMKNMHTQLFDLVFPNLKDVIKSYYKSKSSSLSDLKKFVNEFTGDETEMANVYVNLVQNVYTFFNKNYVNANKCLNANLQLNDLYLDLPEKCVNSLPEGLYLAIKKLNKEKLKNTVQRDIIKNIGKRAENFNSIVGEYDNLINKVLSIKQTSNLSKNYEQILSIIKSNNTIKKIIANKESVINATSNFSNEIQDSEIPEYEKFCKDVDNILLINKASFTTNCLKIANDYFTANDISKHNDNLNALYFVMDMSGLYDQDELQDIVKDFIKTSNLKSPLLPDVQVPRKKIRKLIKDLHQDFYGVELENTKEFEDSLDDFYNNSDD